MSLEISYKILSPSKLEVKYKDKIIAISGEYTLNKIFFANYKDLDLENLSLSKEDKFSIIECIRSKSLLDEIKIIFD